MHNFQPFIDCLDENETTEPPAKKVKNQRTKSKKIQKHKKKTQTQSEQQVSAILPFSLTQRIVQNIFSRDF